LWIPNAQHHERIRQILSSLDSSLIARYAELYQDAPQPSASYRQHLNQRLLALCARYGLAPRIPEHVYEQALPADVVAELRWRNQQFIRQND
jgi:hypothetical protein